MSDWRRSVWWSPARLLTVLGFCLLGFSLYIPWLSASRTTRVELRGDRLAACLLEAACAFEPPLTEFDREAILARFYLLAGCRELRLNHVKLVESPPPEAILCLTTKHYAIQLSESPPDQQQRPGKNTTPALEVMAWPLRVVGPAHSAFFYPENASRAYSRNLRQGYAGLGPNRPKPGQSHRQPGLGSKRPSQYVGYDGERWIRF